MSNTNLLVNAPIVTLAGTPVHDLDESLVEIRVEQAVSVASRAVVRLHDPFFKLVDSAKYKIGAEIKIAFGSGRAMTTVFIGNITVISIEQHGGERHELVIEAMDGSHTLGHASKIRTFLKSSYADVVSKIATEAGLTYEVDGSLHTPVHEYLLQSGTDYAMLEHIAVLTASQWTVDDGKIKIGPRPTGAPAVRFTFGDDLVRFKARYSASGGFDEVEVRGWDPATKSAVVASKKGFASTRPGTSVNGGVDSMRRAAPGVGKKLIIGSAGATTQGEATVIATAIGDRQAASELVARGEAYGTPKLKAGAFVEIAGVGTSMSGKYFVTSVEHIFGRGDLVTRFSAGGLQNSSIVDLLGSDGATRGLGGWTSSGLVVGIVTDNNDPDNLGRVKVKFPTLSDQEASTWARVAALGGGSGQGFHVTPAINDEVIVGFEHGDMRRPFVLGSLWNGKAKPPFASSDVVDGGTVKKWAVHSRAGHLLTFDDTDGDTLGVSITHGKSKSKLVIGEKLVQLIAEDNGGTLEVKTGKASIVLKGDDITIKANNITLEATQDIKLKGLNIDAKANAAVKVEATGDLGLKGAAGTLEGTSMLTLKGGIVGIN